MSDRLESAYRQPDEAENDRGAVGNLFDAAYDFSSGLIGDIKCGGTPVLEGIKSRFEENPQEATLEGLGLAAAGGLAIAAIPAEAATAGVLGAASVTALLGVGVFESFKQIERLEKEWSKDGNPFNWERIFRDRQYNNQRSINNSYYNINHHNFFRY